MTKTVPWMMAMMTMTAIFERSRLTYFHLAPMSKCRIPMKISFPTARLPVITQGLGDIKGIMDIL